MDAPTPPGAVVLLRGLYDGRVRWAFPHSLVFDEPGSAGLLLRPGTPGKWTRRDPSGRYLHRWLAPSPLDDHRWERTRVLRIEHYDKPWAVGVFWDDATDALLGWYVNLQTPIRKTAFGYDMVDHALDVWVPVGGEPERKDDADLEEAARIGVFSAAEVESIRDAARRVLVERPWPTGWEGWRPDPSWPLPLTLPSDWARTE